MKEFICSGAHLEEGRLHHRAIYISRPAPFTREQAELEAEELYRTYNPFIDDVDCVCEDMEDVKNNLWVTD